MKKSYTILGIIAVIIIVIYVMIPKERFAENVFPLGEGTKAFAYDDNADGGTSVVRFASSDSLVSFQCAMGMREKSPDFTWSSLSGW